MRAGPRVIRALQLELASKDYAFQRRDEKLGELQRQLQRSKVRGLRAREEAERERKQREWLEQKERARQEEAERKKQEWLERRQLREAAREQADRPPPAST